MGLVESVRALQGRVLRDEEGNRVELKLQPAPSATRLAEMEAVLGGRLPKDLRALLQVCSGVDVGAFESLDFADIDQCPREELFGVVLTIVGDGAGNFWVVELRPGREEVGPVWFLCHDPAVLVYQSATLEDFVRDWLRAFENQGGPVQEMGATLAGAASHPVQVHTREAALQSADHVLRDFAQSLTPDWFLRDLRGARLGDGMPLGHFGPATPLARAPGEFVFAYASRTRLQRVKSWFTGS